jgi:hypothetical protein
MIKKAAINRIVKTKLGEWLSPQGYLSINEGPEIIASFEKEDDNYFYSFNCYTEKYDVFRLVYGFSFGIKRIVEILKEIDAHVMLSRRKYAIKNSITAVSPGLLLDPLHITRAYNTFNTEEELLARLKEIEQFYEQTFKPFCKRFSDINELNSLINSYDDFWKDSWGKHTPIAFFHVTRLIIARMANDPNFEEIVERNFQALEELWKAQGAEYDRTDSSKPEVFAVEYLRSSRF